MHEAQGNSGEMPLPERGSPFYPGLFRISEKLSSTWNTQYEHDFPPGLRSATPCAKIKSWGRKNQPARTDLGMRAQRCPAGGHGAAAHTGQFPWVLKSPRCFWSTSYCHRKTSTTHITGVSGKWNASTQPQDAKGRTSPVCSWPTASWVQQASSVRGNQNYTAEIQRCCIHGKLQLRTRPLWCQNAVLIQVF